MKITNFRIQNLKSIADSGMIALGPVTLLVGKNNVGKSSILQGIYSMQALGEVSPADVRKGSTSANIEIKLAEIDGPLHWNIPFDSPVASLRYSINANGSQQNMMLGDVNGPQAGVNRISSSAPASFIFPFLSGRKVNGYQETINQQQSLLVAPTLTNLVARVDTLMDQHHPQHEMFMTLVAEVINLKLSAVHSTNGKRVGMWISSTEAIYLEDMGAGIAQMLGLIVNICLAEDSLFLIEELENDIHPEALKLLISAIERNRHKNQYVISTHNNIVLRNLGSLEDTKIYELNSETTR